MVYPKFNLICIAVLKMNKETMTTDKLADALKSALKHLNNAIEIAERNDPTNADHSIWARDYVLDAIAEHERNE